MDILSFQEAHSRRIDHDLSTEGYAWNSDDDAQPRLSLYDPHELIAPPTLRLVCASDEQ